MLSDDTTTLVINKLEDILRPPFPYPEDMVKLRIVEVIDTLSHGIESDETQELIDHPGLLSIQPEKNQVQIIPTHLVNRGKHETTCCNRLPFELPRDDRITVNPDLATCQGDSE